MSVTQAATEYCGLLLERWAVVSRASVGAEEPVGGFSGLYPVLSTLSDAGVCQRIYAIEGAGGAQFALPGVVDEIRACVRSTVRAGVLVLAAVDPANPYGAIATWPDTPAGASTQRPSRRSGALVALTGGRLLGWLDGSGGNLSTWCDDDPGDLAGHDQRTTLLKALANARVELLDGQRALLTSIDGLSLVGAPNDDSARGHWVRAALAAGLTEAPRGWRWPSRA